MKIKFNKFERVAGLCVLFCFVGILVVAIGLAVKRGWFDKKIYYRSFFESAAGVVVGTVVNINGLRAGAVDFVELKGDNKIEVVFYVLGRFEDKVREDSVVIAKRPFIIGEKVLDLKVGSMDKPMLTAQSHIKSEVTTDIMDMLSGGNLKPYIDTLMGMSENMKPYIDALKTMSENLKIFSQAFADTSRTKSIIKVLDQIEPLIKNFNVMSEQVIILAKHLNWKGNVGKLTSNLTALTGDAQQSIPYIRENVPRLSQNIEKLVVNLSVITEEFKAVLPAIAEIAPEIPSTSHKAIEALNETVIVLKAFQKSFMFKGAAEEAREEEKRKDQEYEKQRKPASQ